MLRSEKLDDDDDDDDNNNNNNNQTAEIIVPFVVFFFFLFFPLLHPNLPLRNFLLLSGVFTAVPEPIWVVIARRVRRIK